MTVMLELTQLAATSVFMRADRLGADLTFSRLGAISGISNAADIVVNNEALPFDLAAEDLVDIAKANSD